MAAKPTKPPTIASLVRLSGKNEQAFNDILTTVLTEEEDVARVVEYLSRLNLPKTMEESEGYTNTEDDMLEVKDFDTEIIVSEGFTKFTERHIRKLKWHVSHPSMESVGAVTLLYRSIGMITRVRIRRIVALLNKSEILSPYEWGTSRELLNRTFRSFRSATNITTRVWLESMLENMDPQEVKAASQHLPLEVRKQSNSVAGLRDDIEAARLTLGVKPEGYPVVKPPRYFGGDILEATSWKHFWGEVSNMADSLYNMIQL